MANQVWAWEQHPLYVEACRTQVLPGGSTQYPASRNVGLSPTDRTTFIAGQADWSADNLPEILYYLFAPGDRDAFKTKPTEMLRDTNGNVVREQWPELGVAAKVMYDYPVLPLQISSQEYPWIIDAWRKLDPRIESADILMRMEPAGRPAAWNTFQQRIVRLRPHFNILSWHGVRQNPHLNPPTARIIAGLHQWQIEANTTRGSTPGLYVPEMGEDGGRVPLPQFEESRGYGRRYRNRGQGQQGGVAVGSQTVQAQGSSSGSTSTRGRKRRRGRPSRADLDARAAEEEEEPEDDDETEESAPTPENQHSETGFPTVEPIPRRGRQLNPFELLGRRSTMFTNVVGSSGGHRQKSNSAFRPFTVMDAANAHRAYATPSNPPSDGYMSQWNQANGTDRTR